MKTALIIIIFFLGVHQSIAQKTNPDYDSTLAIQLGADEYGMKNYIFVMLKSGDNKTTDKAFKDSCFTGHMNNINRLVDEGKLIIAGPFGKNDNSFRGIFILDVTTIEEAEELIQTDPAINSNILAADLYEWYGSAALPVYIETSDKIWKIGF